MDGVVGLFGGSFNPPHLGHLIVAETVREQFGLAQVLWMPGHQPPHKHDHRLADPAHRLAMTRLATEGHPAFAVSDLEIRRRGLSYTLDTVEALQDAHPDVDFALILGGDSLASFRTWHRPDAILARVPLLVYRRPGDDVGPLDADLRARVRTAEAPLIDVSSTDLRARCRAGRSIRYRVPDAVRAYIDAHGLYR